MTTRDSDMLRLRWKTEGDRAFPMPVEVRIGDTVRRVEVPADGAAIVVPDGAHVTIDPAARILRRSVAVEEYQAWKAAQTTAR